MNTLKHILQSDDYSIPVDQHNNRWYFPAAVAYQEACPLQAFINQVPEITQLSSEFMFLEIKCGPAIATLDLCNPRLLWGLSWTEAQMLSTCPTAP